MRILVTGAAGFIGSHVCEALLRKGHFVTGLDNLDSYYPLEMKRENIDIVSAVAPERFAFLRLDIRDTLPRVPGLKDIDCVIHCAAMAGVRYSVENPMLYYDVNVHGTLNLLEWCRQNEVKKFIFTSSSSVYGNARLPFRETEINLTMPALSPYAASKRAGEDLCNLYAHLHDVRICVLRLFTVYGPRQRPDLAVRKFLEASITGDQIIQYGSGESSRDYTYVDDVTKAFILAVKRIKHDGKICVFNVGTNKTTTLHQLVRLCCVEGKGNIIFGERRKGDVAHTRADIYDAAKYLSWIPEVDIETGVNLTWQWLRERAVKRSSCMKVNASV